MAKITDLREGRAPDRVKLFLDGRLSLTLLPETAARQGLEVGHELSSGQLDDLSREDRQARCRSAALAFLAYRPRSESELRQRLFRRGFDETCVDSIIGRLREDRLLDDKGFAEFWRDNRRTFRPRSQRLTALELRRKGVSPEVVREVVADVDDAESAYQAARSRLRSMHGLPYAVWRQKMGSFLKRRGFSYEVASGAMKRLWQETAGE